MNYERYIKSRMFDIGYIRAKLRRLFKVLSDADFESVQKLLEETEGILKKYVTDGS
jgi:hypothetical protein